MRTYVAKVAEIEKNWVHIDAEGVVLGRLAAVVANLLRGKHKPTFSRHQDCGDHIIITNADKVKITGKKLQDHIFHWHTGFPGGIKGRSQQQILEGRFPERVVIKAVERMVPRGSLGSQQMTHLHVYTGAAHPHTAQQPKTIDMGERNAKNKRTNQN